jgi:replicative DNA helicase
METVTDEQPATNPRCDNHAEQAVLGAMLQDRHGDVFDEITTILAGPQAFYRGTHAAMYEALLALRASGLPIGDELTFTEMLDSDQMRRVGGVPYIHTCIQAVPTVANGPWYARRVAELALLRDLEAHGVKTIQAARQAAPGAAVDTLELVQADAGAISLGGSHDLDIPTWATAIDEAVQEVEAIGEMAKKGIIPGVLTGWSDLDRLLNGLRGGQVIVIAGRPGIGKSIAGRCVFQRTACVHNQDAFLFTLEMTRSECVMAMLSAGARVPLDRIRSGQLDVTDWTRIAKYLGETNDAPAFIDDRPGIGIAHARQVLRRHIARGRKPRLLVWDYLQITKIPTVKGRSREQDIAELSREFKLLAKEFDIPVILISQLNRGPEQRADKRPTLGDLRESGSIEQDADVVILLHRDDYYDKESPRSGEADFIIAKHRGGPTDTVTLAAQLHLQQFTDMAIV